MSSEGNKKALENNMKVFDRMLRRGTIPRDNVMAAIDDALDDYNGQPRTDPRFGPNAKR